MATAFIPHFTSIATYPRADAMHRSSSILCDNTFNHWSSPLPCTGTWENTISLVLSQNQKYPELNCSETWRKSKVDKEAAVKQRNCLFEVCWCGFQGSQLDSQERAQSRATIPASGPTENFRWGVKFYTPVRSVDCYGPACALLHKKYRMKWLTAHKWHLPSWVKSLKWLSLS